MFQLLLSLVFFSSNYAHAKVDYSKCAEFLKAAIGSEESFHLSLDKDGKTRPVLSSEREGLNIERDKGVEIYSAYSLGKNKVPLRETRVERWPFRGS